LSSSPILVIGSAGQLGTAFKERLADSAELVAVSRADVDVSNGDALRRLIDRTAPALIVNCSAYNDVDGAEMHPGAATQVNGAAVAVMAAAARDRSATLVHFSSDFVFDGRKPVPYTENDQPNPISAYGRSKLAGERHAATAERHYILRLSSVYGGHTRRAYVDRILSRIGSGERVAVFTDRNVSPSYVPEIVEATTPRGVGAERHLSLRLVDFGTWA
jgi:dTDP-4-dehydrorhamnose reductase